MLTVEQSYNKIISVSSNTQWNKERGLRYDGDNPDTVYHLADHCPMGAMSYLPCKIFYRAFHTMTRGTCAEDCRSIF